MEGNDKELGHSSSSGGEDSDLDDESTGGVAAGETHARNKREVAGSACGNVERRCHCPEPCRTLHHWASAGVHLDPSRSGNAVYSSRMQLYCRTGFHLAIMSDGKVIGSPDDYNKFAVLELSSVNFGEVRIRGVEANLFLAMDKKGKLYGEKDVSEEGTIFVEVVAGQYNAYLSRKYAHLGWYVAIKKSGKCKNGSKTAWGQKSTHFLPRRT